MLAEYNGRDGVQASRAAQLLAATVSQLPRNFTGSGATLDSCAAVFIEVLEADCKTAKLDAKEAVLKALKKLLVLVKEVGGPVTIMR